MDFTSMTTSELRELRRNLPHRDGESVTDYENRHYAVVSEIARREAAVEMAAQRAEQARLVRVQAGDASAMTKDEFAAHLSRQGLEAYDGRPIAPAEQDAPPGTPCTAMTPAQWQRHLAAVMDEVARPQAAELPTGVSSAMDLSGSEWRAHLSQLGIGGDAPMGAACDREGDLQLAAQQRVRHEREDRDLRRRTVAAIEAQTAALTKLAAPPSTSPAASPTISPERRAEIATARAWAASRVAR